MPPPVGLASGLWTDASPFPETPRDRALSPHSTEKQKTAGTWAVAWLGQLKNCRWTPRKRPPWGPPPWTQVFFLAGLSSPSWFGPKPSPGFLRGNGPRTWDPSPPPARNRQTRMEVPCELGGLQRAKEKTQAEGPAFQMGFELQ
ncbi:uncharacterized protein [Macaca nemestrina]|uniref:uncharacterized protein isoform X2 n=1 Tax=Macaca nemestrina TaxID=9545 RepID=UPI0039B94AF6